MRRKTVVAPWLAVILVFFGSALCFSQSDASRPQQLEMHSRQAQEYLRQNRPDLAIPEFSAIVALSPVNVDARVNLGVLLFFQSDYAEAIPQLEAALRLKPTLWKIQALLGIAQKRTGNTKSGVPNLEKAFPKLKEEKIQVETGMELVEVYAGANDLEKATAVLGTLRSFYPTNVEVLYASYRIHLDLAAESMLKLSLVAPQSARMHQAMAHEMARHGDYDGAIRNYREAIEQSPSLPGLHFELAEILNTSSVAGDQEQAEAEYKAALAVNHFDQQSERRLGDVAAKRGDQKDASEHYSRALRLHPDDPEALLGLAKILIATGDRSRAQTLLEKAIQQDPTMPSAHYLLATLYRLAGRTSDAKHELDEFEKYKKMKEQLKALYREMRVMPPAPSSDDADSRE